MKFYNRRKKSRQSWNLIEGPIWYSGEAKKWCQDNPSDGRFHFNLNGAWRFEKEDDALVFKLRWGTGFADKKVK